MKTFKQHLEEHSGGAFKRQWDDQDTMPSSEHAIEALNSLVGQVAEHEYLNPKVGIEVLESQLGKLGYHFDKPTLDGGNGQYSIPLRYGNGTFRANYDENPYGEYQETDGISEHIEGGISLVVTVTPIGNGKSMVSPEIRKNADVEQTE